MSDFNVQRLAVIIPFLLLGLTAHEYAHAYAAYRLGDDTAAKNGRLSFNPLRHLDLMGTLVLLLTNFIGWAKPVPVDVRNFRNPTRDMSLVAIAGPLANFSLAIILALCVRFGIIEGFYDFLPDSVAGPLALMFFFGFLINLGLSIFNLLPFPPLDGFNFLAYFLPRPMANQLRRYSQFTFILLIILMFTGVIGQILKPIVSFFFTLLLGEEYAFLLLQE